MSCKYHFHKENTWKKNADESDKGIRPGSGKRIDG